MVLIILGSNVVFYNCYPVIFWDWDDSGVKSIFYLYWKIDNLSRVSVLRAVFPYMFCSCLWRRVWFYSKNQCAGCLMSFWICLKIWNLKRIPFRWTFYIYSRTWFMISFSYVKENFKSWHTGRLFPCLLACFFISCFISCFWPAEAVCLQGHRGFDPYINPRDPYINPRLQLQESSFCPTLILKPYKNPLLLMNGLTIKIIFYLFYNRLLFYHNQINYISQSGYIINKL